MAFLGGDKFGEEVWELLRLGFFFGVRGGAGEGEALADDAAGEEGEYGGFVAEYVEERLAVEDGVEDGPVGDLWLGLRRLLWRRGEGLTTSTYFVIVL